MLSGLIRIAVASFIAAAVPCGSFAQEAPATSPTAPSSAPAAPPAAKPAETPSATTPPPAAPEAAKPSEPAASSGEGSTGEIVDFPARPFAYVEGKADRDEIYSAILGSLGLVRRELDKAGLKPSGRPIAVFVESDDTGFRYHAGYPLDAPPGDKANLSDAVRIGETPSGKAM